MVAGSGCPVKGWKPITHAINDCISVAPLAQSDWQVPLGPGICPHGQHCNPCFCIVPGGQTHEPPGGQKQFFPGAPDLAVEVLSPNDRASDVNAKVQTWLDAGAVVVLVVDPQTQTVAVHRQPREVQILVRDDFLTIADLLPEFSLPVKEIFV